MKLFGVAAGSKDRQLVFPAEVCRVVGGQLYTKKLSPDATAKVVPLATKAPQARLDTIMNGIGQGKTGAITAPVSDSLATISALINEFPRVSTMDHRRSSKQQE